MPTPDMSDPGDDYQGWLNQLLTSLSAGGGGPNPFTNANPGASQPAVSPTLGVGRGGVMPGGVRMPGTYPYPASTPGAPSMGYPAMRPPDAAPPAPSPPAQRGYSGLFSGDNPLVQFGGFHPENILNAQDIAAAKSQLFGNGPSAGPAAPAPIDPYGGGGGGFHPPARPVSRPYPQPFESGFPSPDAASPGNVPVPPHRPVTPTPATAYAAPTRTPGAPNLGYYGGDNSRFVQIDRPNMTGMGARGGGPPQMTALNLAGLFGGGGQAQAAPNPNVPAPNAMPVSAQQRGTTSAPWDYGPLQRNIGWPSKTPYGPDWRDWAAAHFSGYR